MNGRENIWFRGLFPSHFLFDPKYDCTFKGIVQYNKIECTCTCTLTKIVYMWLIPQVKK